MGKTSGKTTEADAPFLGADFWTQGKSINGEVLYSFQTENGPAYALQLVKPVEFDGKEHRIVALGNLAGFRMALQAAERIRLQVGDRVFLRCVSETESGKGSPRVDFEVEVEWDEQDDREF